MRPIRTLSCSLLLAVTAGCAQQTGEATQTGGPPPRPPATVEVSVAELGEVAHQLTLVGAVTAARRSVVGSAVDGRVVRVDVEAGDSVSSSPEGAREVGQPIAQLLTDTIDIEIAGTEAELELRRHELAELEAGTRVEEVAQAEARWEAAKAAEKYAEARFARIRALFEQAQSVSEEEFDEARSAALAAQQNLLAAQAAYELAAAGPRPEQKDQALARFRQQQEEVRRLKDLRKKYTIRAPFDGYVVAKHTEVGAWLSRGDPVAEVAELNPIDVEIQVPETLIAQIHLGDEFPVSINALPGDGPQGEKVLMGVVDRIVPSADLRARTFPVKIRLENPRSQDGYLLKAGMLAQTTVSVRPRAALLVPKDALVLDRESVISVVPGPDGALIAREVRVRKGVAKENLIEVEGDLKPGDRVVTRGNERVQNGQPLLIVNEQRIDQGGEPGVPNT